MPETTLAPPPDAKLASEDYSWLKPEPETPGKKMSKKVQANPLVPLGEFLLVSCVACTMVVVYTISCLSGKTTM